MSMMHQFNKSVMRIATTFQTGDDNQFLTTQNGNENRATVVQDGNRNMGGGRLIFGVSINKVVTIQHLVLH
jgi:hypothetical protein